MRTTSASPRPPQQPAAPPSAAALITSFSAEGPLSGPTASGGGAAAATAALTEEQLTLLTLRFDENEFGYIPPDPNAPLPPPSTTTSVVSMGTTATGEAAEKAVLPAVAAAFSPYSAYAFVRDKRAHTSLKDLSGDLATFGRLLEGRIMHHIHEDVHEAFVAVSGQLGNMADPLDAAMAPLKAARGRLEASGRHLSNADSEVTAALAEAQRREAARLFHVGLLQMALTHEGACRVYSEAVAAQHGMHLVVPPGAVGGGVMRGAYTVRPAATATGTALSATSAAAQQQQYQSSPTDESTMRPKVWDEGPADSSEGVEGAAASAAAEGNTNKHYTLEAHDALVDSLVQHVVRLRGQWAALPLAASFLAPPPALQQTLLPQQGKASEGATSASATPAGDRSGAAPSTKAGDAAAGPNDTDGAVAAAAATPMTAAEAAAAVARFTQAADDAANSRRDAFEMLEEASKALHLVLGTALYDSYLASLGNSTSHAPFSSSSSPSPPTGEVVAPAPAAAGLRRFSHLLRTYRLLGDERELAVLYRDVIVRPLIESVISWRAVGEARKSQAAIAQMLAAVKSVLSGRVLHMVPLLRDTFGGAISPIADIVWTAVCDTLVKRLVFLFSPSLPDTLHANYTAAHEILSLLEAHCESPRELLALRGSSDTAMWLRKWNLDVYLVQRTQEVNEAFDALFSPTSSSSSSSSAAESGPYAASESPVAVAPTNVLSLSAPAVAALSGGSALGDIYRYHYSTAFEGLAELALRGFGKGQFLLPIASKQIKIAVGLIHKGLGRIAAAAEATARRSSSNGGGGTPDFAPLCYLMKDLSTFEGFVRKDFSLVAKASMGELRGPTASSSTASPQIADSTGSSSSSNSHALAAVLRLAAACVAERRKAVAALMQGMLVEGAMPLLSQGIAAASTRANVPNNGAPIPSEASRQAVEAAAGFTRFESILRSGSGSSAGGKATSFSSSHQQHDDKTTEIFAAAGRALCGQYQTAVAAALQALFRRLKALQRVKRAAGGAGAGGTDGAALSSEVTEFEKMVLQLYYDARHLEAALARFVGAPMMGPSAAAASVATTQTIFSHFFAPLVARGDWILQCKMGGLNADSPQPPLWPEVNES